jgi:hypothetical protein
MAASQGANEVKLSVEFAGICLYVIQYAEKFVPGEKETKPPPASWVTVLMPTCVPNGGVSAKHEDGDTGARHVPYLLMDAANLTAYDKLLDNVLPRGDPSNAELANRIREAFGPPMPSGIVPDGPQFEVVRRLRREEIAFELAGSDEPIITLSPERLPLPDLSIYKLEGSGSPPQRGIKLKPGLVDDNPPPVELNVRTILRGGKLTATTISESGQGNVGIRRGPDWDRFEAAWVGSIKWERTIPGDSLTIQIRSFDGSQPTPVTLRPVEGNVIALKLANLCETNPLEWRAFEPRFDKDDVDFKWLFRLFDAADGGSLLRAMGRFKFPYPHLSPRGARPTGYTGCTGGQFGLP